MEAFAEQGDSSKQLIILNRCRIYLQVLTLVDVVNSYGGSFTDAIKCQKDHQKHRNYTWPFQPPPSIRMIFFRRKHLEKLLD